MKQGWKLITLGDACEKGSSNVSQNQLNDDAGDYPIYGASGFIKNVSFYHNEKPYLSIVKDGSGVGRVTRMDAYTSVIGTLQYILPKEGIDLNYLYYSLISVDFKKYAAGAAIPHIYFKDYKNEPFLWMPLPEQQRIVAILDEAFAAIAKAKANAEQNLKNAKELFESYLQGVFENGNWEEKKLNEITEVKDGTHESPKYIKEGIPFVTQKNIRQDGLSFSDTRFITEADHEKFYKRSNVTFGDILISMIGANRGMAAIVDDERIFSIKNVGLIKESKNINKYFLLYYLKSSLAMKYVLYMSNGGAQEFVGLTALRSFPIPYPSLKDQQIIVQKLDALSNETKKLEAIYQQKIKDLEELKKSILQKAFAGELRSLEGAEYTNDVATPIAKKKTITSPERA
jgi:type I restriction enzyme S subunit